jgi:hypothetical protein
MNRIWTSVSLCGETGKAITRKMHAGPDYSQAQKEFKDAHPAEHLMVLMPGQIELRTYDIEKEKNHA